MTVGARARQDGDLLKLSRKTGALASALATAFANLIRPDRSMPRVALAPGDVAPDFSLAASDGRTYRLADFAARSVVVIAWFPKAFTSGCTAECTSIGLTKQALGAFDATIFAASCDTVETNRDFAASMGIDFPILSDPDKSVARAYGVLGPLGLPSRWTVYIGTDSRILAIDRDVRTGNHGADIMSALERFGVSRRP
jgi:thioredoxin-dependent peroxiredoxin